MRQKQWNVLTAAAILFIAAGLLWTKAGDGGMPGRLLIITGILLFLVSIVGGSRASAKRLCRCPICGEPLKPAGRWLPGAGYNGTDTISCPRCGALVPVAKREEP